MPNTYVALRTETVASPTPSVTFNLSGISGYTDLVVVMSPISSSGQRQVYMEINGDTGANYSRTILSGTGSSAVSARNSNQNQTYVDYYGVVETHPTNKIIQFMNYANTTTFKTILTRSNDTSLGLDAIVHLWRSTAAITQIKFYIDAVNFAVGSTFSLYGISSSVPQGTAKATGGTITYDNFGRVIHTFTSSGTFTPSVAGLTCDYLVIAGGGGGGDQGNFNVGGGGGAGGFREFSNITLPSMTGYAVTVGAGGGPTSNGSNSSFNSSTATGGGAGGTGQTSNGAAGGSGGGAANGTSPGSGNAGSYTPVEGYAGGSSGQYSGGGGGGAGAVGSNAPGSTTGGNGGNGNTSSISGSVVTYAGGGGGGANNRGSGGSGGGGVGASYQFGTNAGSGTANTGSGGGGNAGPMATGSGGSGVVIIRYQG